jgi:histidine triad (HIT) family protein
MTYDQNNIFAKILKGELACDKVYEDDFSLAFYDINPQAPIHVLIIPKGEYVSQIDFSINAPVELMEGFGRAIGKVANKLGLEDKGYRVITNIGQEGGQVVHHLHYHILGGKPLGPMLSF